ncbi:MAG TPA: hypothetical protein VE262_11830 [Blastocatellia bacterium]|nr:hypothetical protein [Blastocatellia bacterium]
MQEESRKNQGRRVKILFLGQCLNYGYEGVDKSATFVSVAISNLAARFPHLRLQLDRKHLYHPRGLKAILKHRLMLSPPDIAVISVSGIFTAKHTRVNSIYEMAPEVMDTVRSFVQRIEARRNKTAPYVNPEISLDRFSTLHPPLPLEEYERIVREGVELCQARDCRVVLVGPGRFNEDSVEKYTIPEPGLWSSVNDMVLRLSKAMKVSAVDTVGLLSGYSGEVFLPQNIRWSTFGHQVVAREVESVLASQIISIAPAHSLGLSARR